jgi:hypothetical protein
MKGCVYYTDNRLDARLLAICQAQLARAFGGEIVSVSLAPLAFGQNTVLARQPSAVTLFTQILTGLEKSSADVVFLTEHDVLYHPSHFDFEPPNPLIYYYNVNNWRWDYPRDRAITYDGLRSLSGLCAYRSLLLDHYRRRLRLIEQNGWEDGRDPGWARKIGYEPGKKRKRGGFADELMEDWRSEFPNVDIRHNRTLTPPKVTLESFRHPPVNWQETTLDQIPGWNLREMFGL